MESIPKENWPLPNEFLLELGRLTSLWTSIEDQIIVSIGKLAGYDRLTDMRPFILVKHSSFQQKLDILSSLCEHLVGQFPRLRDYKKVISEIKAVQSSRNLYVHNSLVLNEDGKTVELVLGSARGKLKTSIEPVHLEDIQKVSLDISRTLRNLHRLITGQDRSPSWEKDSG